MTEYKPNTQLKFGMYKGSTIENISRFNYNYISWCIANLDHFYISEETIEILESKIKGFRLKEDAIASLEIKRSQMYDSKTSDDYECDYYER
jgi:hypothetical protein